ncbi:hypothetical protein PCANC_03783 [Puccinia coronata f. sp. avenae]|uniref:C2H2-type domain-containing protein n=1 Tax=Puccinia coronata f. sp. avenae TaxID=200324 RepID=A0A2N5UZA9_9BASI|nr:hypothetical protein PCANC_28923 [Puccinia coronata f. sp. avenae]PLW08873.1 hypothetical protein PCASD_26758 [Puccinia coronata f. sp. avenae]PLW43054.1 hypothetical protein PCASD_06064 [Puccinia coronata f. sp. avenae]PLW53900.1 hypothetical protein PCANC_03783 [Puccinia coronata f. sp. avenae]
MLDTLQETPEARPTRRLERQTKRKYADEQDEEEEESESASTTESDSTGSYSPTTNSTHSRPCSPASPHLPQLIILNGKLIDTQTKKIDSPLESQKPRKYRCHWGGCQKSYTKPVRLEEHLRSHTNERPFSCPSCPAAYRRETHLNAHTRMHLPESSRPLLCGWQDTASAPFASSSTSSANPPGACPRRFWTRQHLKIHQENVHQGKKGLVKLRCEHCPREFLKHRALRAHVLEAHCPPGTKPYMCPHPNCGFSFENPSRLRKHERTHDPFRYTCVHQDCLNNPSVSIQQRSFSSWTDLQRHTRNSHPFKCTENDCSRKNKPFKSLRSLKQHIQLFHPPHQQAGKEQDNFINSGLLASSTRNTGSFICDQYPPCARAYKSARALQRHVNLIHLIDRHTSCPMPDCSFSSAFPSGLAKHIKSKHPTSADPASSSPAPLPKRPKLTRIQKITQIDLLTGIGYSNPHPSEASKNQTQSSFRKFACPFFQLNINNQTQVHQNRATQQAVSVEDQENNQAKQLSQATEDSSIANQTHNHTDHPPLGGGEESRTNEKCLFRFNRLYDIQRHLKSYHSLTVERETLKDFFGVV